MKQVTIGIDISKEILDAHCLNNGVTRQFSNDAKGHKAFIAWVGPSVERVVFEPTGPYHRAFERALARAGLPMVKVNPRHARRFAEATGQLAKTDKLDAALLAKMGALLQLESRPAPDEIIVDLRELHVARNALIKEQTAAKNRDKELRITLLKRQNANRLKQTERQIRAIEAEIMTRIENDPALAEKLHILTSIPGIGNLTACALIIEMPELGTLDAGQAASLAGLAPMTRQSGTWRGKSFIQGGRGSVRKALFMPALVTIRYNPDLKAKYDQFIAARKPPKLAVTAIMRKIIVLANALLKAGRPWRPKLA